jgi:hypothetical protein
MKLKKYATSVVLLSSAFLLMPRSVDAQKKTAAQPTRHVATLRNDVAGREPKTFLPMVGTWTVTTEAGKKVVFVDGRAWKRGQPAGGLADKARQIYGKSHEEFIESVQAFAYYPIAVYRDVADFRNGDISTRFMMVGGTLDRCAGILFNVKPNGDYLALRFNGTEDNVVLWTFNNGKRSMVKRAPGEIPLELGTWHELKLSVHGTSLTGYVDGKNVFEYTLPEPVTGKVGLWSKTDSMVEFADFTVTQSSK